MSFTKAAAGVLALINARRSLALMKIIAACGSLSRIA
jgi:hypothetical protein